MLNLSSHQVVLGVIVLAIVIVIGLRLISSARRSSAFSSQGGKHSADANCQVYIGNISYRVRERELREFFETYGAIAQLRIVKHHQTGRSKGFGFITFEQPAQANAALKAHDALLNGRALVVRIAKPK